MISFIFGSEADKDGKPIVNYYFAGKVNIDDVEKIVFVRTRKSEGRANRFYVHEIFTEDEIAKLGSQQTDAALANTSRKYRNASEFYRNIIAKVLNYKLLDEKIHKIRKMQIRKTKTDLNGRGRTSRTSRHIRRYGWSYGGQAGRDGGEKIGEEKFLSSPGIFRFYLQ